MSTFKIDTPSLVELAGELAIIENSTFIGTKGVRLFDSGVSGPCVGITIHTHGNEPSGLAAFRYFRLNEIGRRLTKGSVMFVLNNLRATHEYFNTLKITDLEAQEKAKLKARFCEVNMNRLPGNAFELQNDRRYEVLRAQELRPVWAQFDAALDIHSTRSESEPMIIAIGDIKEDLYKGFPIDVIIRNIERIQTGRPASSFYGNSWKIPVFGIEAGSHEDRSSFEIAAACVVRLLKNMDMLPGGELVEKRQYREYAVNGSLFFHNDSYELIKPLTMFEEVQRGQVIAEGNLGPITVLTSGHVLMTPPGTKATAPLSDEVLFFSAPVRMIKTN